MERYTYLYGTNEQGIYTALGSSAKLGTFFSSIGSTQHSATIDYVRYFLYSGCKELLDSAYANNSIRAVRYMPLYLHRMDGMPNSIKPFCTLGISGLENRPGRNTIFDQTVFLPREQLLQSCYTKGQSTTFLDQIFSIHQLSWQELRDIRERTESFDYDSQPEQISVKLRNKDSIIILHAVAAALDRKPVLIKLEEGCDFNERSLRLLEAIYSLLPNATAVETGFAVHVTPSIISEFLAKTEVRLFVAAPQFDLSQINDARVQIVDANHLETIPAPARDDKLVSAIARWIKLSLSQRQEAMSYAFPVKDYPFVNRDVYISKTEGFFDDAFFRWINDRNPKTKITSLEELTSFYNSFPVCRGVSWVKARFESEISKLLDRDRISAELKRECAVLYNGDKSKEALVRQSLAILKIAAADFYGSSIAELGQNNGYEKSRQELDQKDSEISGLKGSILQIKQAHADELQYSEQLHADEIQRINQAHNAELQQNDQLHADDIQLINQAHAEELQQLKKSHVEELQIQAEESLKKDKEHEKELTELVSKQEAERLRHAQEINGVKEKANSIILEERRKFNEEIESRNRAQQEELERKEAEKQQELSAKEQLLQDERNVSHGLRVQITKLNTDREELIKASDAAEKRHEDELRKKQEHLDEVVSAAKRQIQEAKSDADRRIQEAKDKKKQLEEKARELQSKEDKLGQKSAAIERREKEINTDIRKNSIIFSVLGFCVAAVIVLGFFLVKQIATKRSMEVPAEPATIEEVVESPQIEALLTEEPTETPVPTEEPIETPVPTDEPEPMEIQIVSDITDIGGFGSVFSAADVEGITVGKSEYGELLMVFSMDNIEVAQLGESYALLYKLPLLDDIDENPTTNLNEDATGTEQSDDLPDNYVETEQTEAVQYNCRLAYSFGDYCLMAYGNEETVNAVLKCVDILSSYGTEVTELRWFSSDNTDISQLLNVAVSAYDQRIRPVMISDMYDSDKWIDVFGDPAQFEMEIIFDNNDYCLLIKCADETTPIPDDSAIPENFSVYVEDGAYLVAYCKNVEG